MSNKLEKILISRTDNLGDVILTLPLAHIIKKHYLQCHVTFLCSEYTATACNQALDVDDTIIWDQLKNLPRSKAIKQIRQHKFDTVIHAFTNTDISKIMYQAGIKVRIDQGRRFYKILYSNNRIGAWKHISGMHHAQLVTLFLKALKLPCNYTVQELVPMIRISAPTLDLNIRKHLDPHRFNIIFHPFSNKHGREWPLDYFFQLTKSLDISKYHIIITGSSTEGEPLQDTPLNDPQYVTNLCGKTSLTELFSLLAHADGIVVSSTGPLHMAAALGTRCLGLFPKEDIMSKTRWQALGPRATSIATDKPCTGSCSNTDCACMRALTPQMVQGYIEGWYLAWQHEKSNSLTLQEQTS